jgi:hypothetical protein
VQDEIDVQFADDHDLAHGSNLLRGA